MGIRKELKNYLEELRADLEGPLEEAEEAIHKEKVWLTKIYKGMSGEDTVSDAQVDLSVSWSYGFLSDNLIRAWGNTEESKRRD